MKLTMPGIMVNVVSTEALHSERLNSFSESVRILKIVRKILGKPQSLW